MILDPNQIRAARGMANWTVAYLAEKVGVGTTTISAIETGRSSGSLKVIAAIIYAFKNAGIEFTEDGGVRPLQSKIYTFQGHKGFCAFFDDIYDVAKTHENPDICITNVNEAKYDQWLGSYEPVHVNRMTKLKSRLRVLMKDYDLHLTSTSYCEYRWVPAEQFADVSLYIYGTKTAFIEFYDHNVVVTLVDNNLVTDSLRKMFEITWEKSYKSPYDKKTP